MANDLNGETKFLINQRVIVGDEIGTVQRGPSHPLLGSDYKYQHYRDGYVWVHLPSNGYASQLAVHNVKPLPNGQL